MTFTNTYLELLLLKNNSIFHTLSTHIHYNNDKNANDSNLRKNNPIRLHRVNDMVMSPSLRSAG